MREFVRVCRLWVVGWWVTADSSTLYVTGRQDGPSFILVLFLLEY